VGLTAYNYPDVHSEYYPRNVSPDEGPGYIGVAVIAAFRLLPQLFAIGIALYFFAVDQIGQKIWEVVRATIGMALGLLVYVALAASFVAALLSPSCSSSPDQEYRAR
jgi:hypothetical protein